MFCKTKSCRWLNVGTSRVSNCHSKPRNKMRESELFQFSHTNSEVESLNFIRFPAPFIFFVNDVTSRHISFSYFPKSKMLACYQTVFGLILSVCPGFHPHTLLHSHHRPHDLSFLHLLFFPRLNHLTTSHSHWMKASSLSNSSNLREREEEREREVIQSTLPHHYRK